MKFLNYSTALQVNRNLILFEKDHFQYSSSNGTPQLISNTRYFYVLGNSKIINSRDLTVALKEPLNID